MIRGASIEESPCRYDGRTRAPVGAHNVVPAAPWQAGEAINLWHREIAAWAGKAAANARELGAIGDVEHAKIPVGDRHRADDERRSVHRDGGLGERRAIYPAGRDRLDRVRRD